MMPKEKSRHRGSGKVYCLNSNLETGACFYLHALNKEAHECLSEPSVHRSFAPHCIIAGNGARPVEFIFLMGKSRHLWEGSNVHQDEKKKTVLIGLFFFVFRNEKDA